MKRFIQRFVPMYHGFLNKIRVVFGNAIVIDDASDEPLAKLRVFGKSTQNGTPTPTAPVEIVSVENPKVNIDNQTLSVPYTLHGIPVTSGGNYTDANGQQWICDEVDFERGVYVQRITHLTLPVAEMNNTEDFPGWKRINQLLVDFPEQNKLLKDLTSVMCNGIDSANIGVNTTRKNDGVNSSIWFQKTGLTQSEWIAMYPDLVFTILYASPKSIETPLTSDQIAAYKALHTNEPNTTIYNDQNAWMEVKYISK